MDMKVSFPGGAKVDAEYRGFTIRTDQPTRGGGDGTAPAPFDYFLASLGTCAGYYVLAFLQQRSISADDVQLVMSLERDPERRMLGKITIKVLLPREFPDKYKNAIINAVNLCAVKKHIHEPPVFETVVMIGDNEAAVSTT
jgi:ribosomal protein S12 methylthiotransferase accessory factor